MRGRYWAMYTALKHKEFYYENYSIRAKRINGTITGFLTTFSLGGVSSWFIWDYSPLYLIGPILAAVAQLVQALAHHHFPFAKQVSAFKFLLPKLSELMLKIDSSWLDISVKSYNDKTISKLTTQYQAEYNELIAHYTNSLYLPEIKRCDEKATIDSKSYFKQHYNV